MAKFHESIIYLMCCNTSICTELSLKFPLPYAKIESVQLEACGNNSLLVINTELSANIFDTFGLNF